MKVKDFLENYQGNSVIEIYDCFDWKTVRCNKAMAIKDYGYYTVRSWTVLALKNKISITIMSQF